MNAAFREALRVAYQTDGSVYTDFRSFDSYMERFAAEDMLSYSLSRTCLLIPEEMNKLREACAENNDEKTMEICRSVERILQEEHGIRPYHAAWAMNCWLYAMNAHRCYFNSEYIKTLEAAPSERLIPMANSGDAYAVCVLYMRDTNQKEWLDRMEQYDHPASIYYRAVDLRGDFSDPEKNKQSLGLCLKAFDMGYARASAELAVMYQGIAGIEKNAVDSFKYACIAANLGIPACIRMVSDAYWNGDGVEANPKVSFAYLERLAESGDLQAQIMCACSYFDGTRGADKNEQKSFHWLEKAAEQGESKAQFLVGESLRRGEGVPKNVSEAIRYYKASAEQGNVEALIQLGKLYFLGNEVQKNEQEAAMWYKKAAEAGSGFACSILADLYRAGIGVPRNLARADQYDRRAKELGYEQEPEKSETGTQKMSYIDDNWDIQNLGKGDGITEIRDPEMKKLFSVMRDTWNIFASIAEDRGLSLYAVQGRAYMYMLCNLAMTCCTEIIPDFQYYLLNFIYGSSCRAYMSDSAAEYFDKEFGVFCEKFDNIYIEEDAEKNTLQLRMMCYMSAVNKVLGKYSDEVARDISARQVLKTNQFCEILRLIMQKHDAK